jgi:YHS domain-containing protein
MIRSLLIFVFIVVVYYAVKTVFRSALKSYHGEDQKRTRIMGEDMVQDPECRTYVPKGRAVTRRVGGRLCHFCSEACAQRYEEKNRA